MLSRPAVSSQEGSTQDFKQTGERGCFNQIDELHESPETCQCVGWVLAPKHYDAVKAKNVFTPRVISDYGGTDPSSEFTRSSTR